MTSPVQTRASDDRPAPENAEGFAAEPAWVKPALDQVQTALEKDIPSFPPTMARIEALSILDGPLHVQTANRFLSVHQFLEKRLTDTISEIESTRVTTGAIVWKLYNHGFVVRTPGVTVGMDLVRGWGAKSGGKTIRFGLTPALTARLARQIDVLTVSHVHGDHADIEMARAALEAGVTVVADPSIFTNEPAHALLVRPHRLQDHIAADPTTSPELLKISLRGGRRVDVLGYPGHQAPATTNTVYLLRTPEGMTMMHTGDQDWGPDAWMDNVARQHPVDILLVNAWSSNLDRMIRGSSPKLVVMGHENEMNHFPDHRETFWRSFQCFRPIETQPYYVLCWGEGAQFPPLVRRGR